MKNIHMLMWLVCMSVSSMMFASSVEKLVPVLTTSDKGTVYCVAAPRKFAQPSRFFVDESVVNGVADVNVVLFKGEDNIECVKVKPCFGWNLARCLQGFVLKDKVLLASHVGEEVPVVYLEDAYGALAEHVKALNSSLNN